MNHLEQGISFVNVKKNKYACEKFFRKGNHIGFIKAHFQMHNNRFVRQHILGVRTENGFNPISLFFSSFLL